MNSCGLCHSYVCKRARGEQVKDKSEYDLLHDYDYGGILDRVPYVVNKYPYHCCLASLLNHWETVTECEESAFWLYLCQELSMCKPHPKQAAVTIWFLAHGEYVYRGISLWNWPWCETLIDHGIRVMKHDKDELYFVPPKGKHVGHSWIKCFLHVCLLKQIRIFSLE